MLGFYGGNLQPHDKIAPLLKAATASFGITALNELQELYNGKSIAEDGAFALEVLKYINNKIDSGEIYLFQIYSKDFSEYSKGTPNMHTLYFKMLFDERNLANVVYKLNGEAEMFYRFPSIKKDEMVIHPKGEPVKNKRANNEKAYSKFDYIYSVSKSGMEKFAERGGFGVNLVTAWQSDSETDRLRCLSLFYSVLAHITAVDNACYADRKKYRIIEPAVEYLKQHIFDIDLKVDNLPELCGISGTYFRKIFQSEFGMTPQKYIINRRLSCARSILESGDFATVTEVAAAVGYADPLYFSQSFHKKYGFPPSQYRRIL